MQLEDIHKLQKEMLKYLKDYSSLCGYAPPYFDAIEGFINDFFYDLQNH